jgi:hypothetical protein
LLTKSSFSGCMPTDHGHVGGGWLAGGQGFEPWRDSRP